MAVESLNSLPLGFRFRPTDEELVDYYLRLKINGNDRDVRVIREIDVCKVEPWDLPGLSTIRTTDSEWFFFCPRDRKYPNGSRLNRATAAGYWKATGKDRNIKSGTSLIGMKKTLVFYFGRAPKGKRTNWVMHEYRPTLQELDGTNPGQSAYVLCRLFKKQDDTIEDFTGNEVEPTASSPTAAKSSPGDTESDAAINQASPFSGERAENENQNHPPYTDITLETVVPAECDAVEASPLLNVAYEPGSDPIYSPLHSQVQAEFGYSSFNDPIANDFTDNINESEDYISRFLDSVLNSEEEAQFQRDFQGTIFPVNETSRVDHETRAYDLSENLHMNQNPESSSRSIGDHRQDGASGIIRRLRVVQNPSSAPNDVMQLQGDASRRLKLEKRSQVEAPEAFQISLLVKWFKHVWIVILLIVCIGVCKFVKL